MRKRLVYRASDIGFTKAFNDGAFKVFDENVATSADIMLDWGEATVDALERLKKYPWVSIGWHRHLWGRPVLDPSEVPSMVDETGRFKWGHRKHHLMNEVTYEDAYKEFCAEFELCIKILGRAPDSASVYGNRPIDQAARDVCIKYGTNLNFWHETSPKNNKVTPADEKYEHLNYGEWPIKHKDMENHSEFDLKVYDKYDPLGHNTSVVWKDDSEIWRVGGHPGYLDDVILAESSCNIHRVKDLQAGICQEFKDWIIENKIELINQRDVVYGTNEFQNHLKEINSPLWIGNMK